VLVLVPLATVSSPALAGRVCDVHCLESDVHVLALTRRAVADINHASRWCTRMESAHSATPWSVAGAHTG
jgi:hypothetical protein